MEIHDLISSGKEVAAHTWNLTLLPDAWEDYDENHSCDWDCEDLNEENNEKIPEVSGVYNLVVEPEIACHPSCAYLMYIGETNDLNRRFYEYTREVEDEKGRPLVRTLLFIWEGYIKFYYIEVGENRRKDVQDSMIEAFRPRFNVEMESTVKQPQKAFG